MASEETALKQLVLEFQTIISKIHDPIEVSFSLYDVVAKEVITEEYLGTTHGS
jgi:hypothetical protein